ncbi:MAG: hypothetical protein R3F07_12945 [Opitutaceae bacterium]
MFTSDDFLFSDACPPWWRQMVACGLVVVTGVMLSGCAGVPVYRQAMVSSPGMLYSNSPVLAAESALLTQLEPGLASNGGGQAAGCTSCR